MGDDVGRDLHAGAVLSFDNIPFAAHYLDRVEETVPDTDAGQRKGAGGRSFLRHEHVGADDKGHKGSDDRADRKDFPVALIDEHAKEFLKVDPDLVDPSGILQIFS